VGIFFGVFCLADLSRKERSVVTSTVTAVLDVQRAYEQVLGRSADDGGLRGYVRFVVEEGKDIGRVREALIESQEYKDKRLQVRFGLSQTSSYSHKSTSLICCCQRQMDSLLTIVHSNTVLTSSLPTFKEYTDKLVDQVSPLIMSIGLC
jgi:hypothetical protein